MFEFAWQGVIPIPGAFYSLVVFGIGIFIILPYLIDRVLAPRLGGMLGTLVFPLAMTTLWYLNGNRPMTWFAHTGSLGCNKILAEVRFQKKNL